MSNLTAARAGSRHIKVARRSQALKSEDSRRPSSQHPDLEKRGQTKSKHYYRSLTPRLAHEAGFVSRGIRRVRTLRIGTFVRSRASLRRTWTSDTSDNYPFFGHIETPITPEPFLIPDTPYEPLISNTTSSSLTPLKPSMPDFATEFDTVVKESQKMLTSPHSHKFSRSTIILRRFKTLGKRLSLKRSTSSSQSSPVTSIARMRSNALEENVSARAPAVQHASPDLPFGIAELPAPPIIATIPALSSADPHTAATDAFPSEPARKRATPPHSVLCVKPLAVAAVEDEQLPEEERMLEPKPLVELTLTPYGPIVVREWCETPPSAGSTFSGDSVGSTGFSGYDSLGYSTDDTTEIGEAEGLDEMFRNLKCSV